MSKFTIKISATLNGKACKNPQVEFIQGAGCIYPCEIKDNEITIETLPGSTDCNCIEGYIKCEDECLNCPPQHFKKCFCDTTEDCQDCETCVDGLCIADCPDKLCINDTCCDCAVTEDCPKGFVCNGCGCNCIGTINSDGECVQCKTKGDCKSCENCIDGKCVPLECPNNLVCVNGGCGCPAGTKYDPVTNSCIPIVCNDDAECGSCESCLSNQCVPINCPAGTKAVITNGVCTCVEWPCVDVTCDNGADCGKGCGCLNGECVPCKYLDCLTLSTCEEALGCECNTLKKCQEVGGCDEEYCDGFNPCSTPGCTCYENKCVSCENFSCDNDECAEQVGCTCKNGKCEAKGCNNEPCSSTENCGVGCVCEGGHCVDGPCSGSCSDSSGCAGENCICVDGQCEQSPDGCKDSFTIVKNCGPGDKDCKLTAKLTTKGCPCDPITFKVDNTSKDEGILTFGIKAYKNNTQPFSEYKTNPNFGDNELLSGAIEFRVDVYDKQGGTLLSSETTATNPNASNVFPQTLIDTDTAKGQKRYVTITVTSKGVKTVNNNCSAYGDEQIGVYVFNYATSTTDASSTQAAKVTKEGKATDKVSNKKPLFIWSRTSAANFRKVYPQGSEGNYTDEITTKAEGLILGDSYTVKTDCAGCTSPVATHSNLEFCCFDPTATTENCNTKVTIVSKPLCGAVKDQAKNYVAINGEEIDISNPITITREFPNGIDSIKSYIKGAVTQCAKDHPLGDETAPAPAVNVNCGVSGATITITPPSGRIMKELYIDGQATAISGAPAAVNTTYFTDTKKAKVVYEGGCFVEFDIAGCVDEIILECNNATNTCENKTGKGSIKAKLKSGKSETFAITNGANKTGTQVEWTNLDTATYTVTVSGKPSILAQTCTINNKKFVDINWSSTGDLCSSGSSQATLTVSATSTNVTGAVSYRIKRNGVVVVNNQTINVGTTVPHNFTQIGTYTLEIITTNTTDILYCNSSSSIILSDNKSTISPTIVTVSEACAGAEIDFVINNIGNLSNISDVTLSVNAGSTIIGTPTISNGQIVGKVSKATSGTLIITITEKTTSCFTFTQATKEIPIKAKPIIGSVNNYCDGVTRRISFNMNTGGAVVTASPATGVTLSTNNGINFTGVVTHQDAFSIVATKDGCSDTVAVGTLVCEEPQCDDKNTDLLSLSISGACTSGTPGLETLGVVLIEKADFESVFGIGTWVLYSVRLDTGTILPLNTSGDTFTLANLQPAYYTLTFTKIGTTCNYLKSIFIESVCCASNPCETMIEGSVCSIPGGYTVLDDCGNPVAGCNCPLGTFCDPLINQCVANPAVIECTCGDNNACYTPCQITNPGSFFSFCQNPGNGDPCYCVCA